MKSIEQDNGIYGTSRHYDAAEVDAEMALLRKDLNNTLEICEKLMTADDNARAELIQIINSFSQPTLCNGTDDFVGKLTVQEIISVVHNFVKPHFEHDLRYHAAIQAAIRNMEKRYDMAALNILRRALQ